MMVSIRVIPTLLIDGGRLVKGVQFAQHRYCGDPMNAVRIYNGRRVDELILLDISATAAKRSFSVDFIRKVSSECLMPVTVGGGIRTLEDVRALLNAGAEKVALNTAAFDRPSLISEIAASFGSQSLVISLDVKKEVDGSYGVYSNLGKKKIAADPVAVAIDLESRGVGEILVNSIDRDGTMTGYDLNLIKAISSAVRVPIIAQGGGGTLAHLAEAINSGGATAVAAGSMFVFHGRRRAVLVNYPDRSDLERNFAQ